MNIYAIMALIALVLIEVTALIQLMISPIGGFLGTIIGPLTGAFVGVFLGFKLNENHRRRLEGERRSFFKNLIMHEVKKSIETLEDESSIVNLIPVDMWNSIVNSGEITLFNGNAIEVSDLYFEIQNYNYEAKRLIYAADEAKSHPLSTNISHISELKDIFTNKTKPNLLEQLRKYEKRIITLNVKPMHIHIGTSEGMEGIHTDANGNLIGKY